MSRVNLYCTSENRNAAQALAGEVYEGPPQGFSSLRYSVGGEDPVLYWALSDDMSEEQREAFLDNVNGPSPVVELEDVPGGVGDARSAADAYMLAKDPSLIPWDDPDDR